MLWVIFLIKINIVPSVSYDSAGTTLFSNYDVDNKCWTSESLTKLRLRSIFEMLMATPPTPNEINGKYVKDILLYYQKSLLLTKRVTDPLGQKLSKESLADAIGAHMRSEVLPAARFAYYGGYLNFADVNKLNTFYVSIKTHLNTRGLGWKEPPKRPPWSNLTVTKISFKPDYKRNSCERLITKRDSNSCIYLPKPRTDDVEKPSALALPLRSGGFSSLTSARSENVLLDYYSTAANCILEQSPPSCRHSDFVAFNNDLWHWMKRHVAPHLFDERIYAAYGGILRVAAATQKYSRGHSYRDSPETENIHVSSNGFWEKIYKPYSILTDSKFSHDIGDIYTVIIVAASILFIQILVYLVVVACKTRPSKKESSVKKHHDGGKFSVQKNPRQGDRSKSLTVLDKGTPKTNIQSNVFLNKYHKTETVYDFNEDKEKVLKIALNDSDNSSIQLEKNISEIDNSEAAIETGRSKSPPKLDVPVTELHIQRPVAHNTAVFHRASLHSEDGTESDSCTTFVQRNVDVDYTWSASESLSSDQTISSKDSKRINRSSRQSRNVEWARRFIYKYSNKRTKLDVGSKSVPKSTSSTPELSASMLRN